MAVLKDLEDKAIVGNCLYSYLSKGNLYINKPKLVLPYILFSIIGCTEEPTLLITSRYNDLIRECKEQLISTTFFLTDSPSSGDGGSSTNTVFKDFVFLPSNNDGVTFPTLTPTTQTTVIYQNRWVWEWTTGWTLLGRIEYLYEPYVNLLSTVTEDIGGIPAGTTAGDLSGDSINTLFDKLLFPTVSPTITVPVSAVLTISTGTNNLEIGTTLIRTLTATFNAGTIQNGDGVTTTPLVGNSNMFTFSGTGISDTSQVGNTLPISTTIIKGVNNWAVSVSYLEGLTDYYDSTGSISTVLDSSRLAGTVVDLYNSPVITGYYNIFYGVGGSTPTNSSEVRSLSSVLDTTNTFELNTGSTYTKFKIVLPPNRLIQQVTDIDALGVIITSEYIEQGYINVFDAGGTSRIYRLYEMNIAIPYSSNHRHIIQIADE